MTTLAPPWALTAVALDGVDDPHLQPGIHLRVLPSSTIGLPVAPLMVDRFRVGSSRRVGRRVDVLWTGADGTPTAPPFELASAGPATAWLPSVPGDPVIYAEVLVEGGRLLRPEQPWLRPPPPITRPIPPFGRPGGPLGRPAGPIGPLGPPIHRLPRGGARADAVVTGILGPAVVASVTSAPYQLCATGMDRVVVSGRGKVTGIRILRAGDLRLKPSREPWRLLALPIEHGARYAGIASAWAAAEDRVARGAPQRLGLHDDPDAPDPASCDAATAADELERIKVLWVEQLEEAVGALIDDLGAPPGQLAAARALGGTAVATASVEVPYLSEVLQGALDPGAGRLLGLVEHDEEPVGAPGDLVVYTVRGGWTRHRGEGWLGALLASATGDPAAFPLELPGIVAERSEGSFLDLWTVAAVVLGRPGGRVPPPTVGAPEDLGWVPEVPPAARRHVVLPLAGLVPGAAVALARDTPGVTGLNPRLPELFPAGSPPDRAVPIVPGVLHEAGDARAASQPGQGEVHDRLGPADGSDYRVAQADWFGRWSGWTNAVVGPGVRPPVPVPVIEAAWIEPATPGASSRLEVRSHQPRDPDLPPGSFPLQDLLVEASVGGGGATPGSAAAVRGAAPSGSDVPPLVVSIGVPPLGPGQRRTLSATARWRDTAGRVSAASPPAPAVAIDPRAPAPITLPNTLEYAARPDALGRSRIRLTWPASAGQAFRVYVSDESTLRQRLSGLGGAGAAALAELGSAGSAPDRAAVFRSSAALFDRTSFELVTPSPLLAATSGSMSFEYEVSGSLSVLIFLKVVPVTVFRTSPFLELGGEADFVSSTLLVRGVPNSPPPPQPLLTAAADGTDPAAVRLTIDVPDGQTNAVAWRLRRSRVTATDALSMPVVATGTSTTWPVVATDRGATPWDPTLRFAPWSTYAWRVEVQGAPEPGSTVPSGWSQPSAPASWRVVPPGPPSAATAGSLTASSTGVQVRFTHPEPLDGGPAGDYRVDVYRRTPSGSSVPSGALPSVSVAVLRQPDGSFAVTDTTPDIPAGTDYLVEISDPLGRRSARVVVATVA